MAETTSRVLSLLNLLQTHRQWPGPELAGRLEVTERTLRRDIERLRELGYNIEATRGVAGGYRLEAGSELPPLLLSDEEAVTMALGLRVAATQGLADGELTTMSALAKFEQVLPAPLRRRVNALAEHVQPQTPRGMPVSQELLGQLALACRDRECIRFRYVDAGGTESERVVEPHSLVATVRSWFLVCWDLQRGDWRTFRADRMSRFFGTRVRFEPRELPAADAAAFVAERTAAIYRKHSAEVVIRMPVEEVKAQLGWWGRDAIGIDETTTSWPISAESLEGLFSALAWIPSGADYELRASDDFLAFIRATTERLGRMMAIPILRRDA